MAAFVLNRAVRPARCVLVGVLRQVGIGRSNGRPRDLSSRAATSVAKEDAGRQPPEAHKGLCAVTLRHLAVEAKDGRAEERAVEREAVVAAR